LSDPISRQTDTGKNIFEKGKHNKPLRWTLSAAP